MGLAGVDGNFTVTEWETPRGVLRWGEDFSVIMAVSSTAATPLGSSLLI